MIVTTLVAKNIKSKTGLILTECKIPGLHDGDRLHCHPDFGAKILAKHPDNFDAEPWWDKPNGLVHANHEWQPRAVTLHSNVEASKLPDPPPSTPEPAKAPQRRSSRSTHAAKEATT